MYQGLLKDMLLEGSWGLEAAGLGRWRGRGRIQFPISGKVPSSEPAPQGERWGVCSFLKSCPDRDQEAGLSHSFKSLFLAKAPVGEVGREGTSKATKQFAKKMILGTPGVSGVPYWKQKDLKAEEGLPRMIGGKKIKGIWEKHHCPLGAAFNSSEHFSTQEIKPAHHPDWHHICLLVVARKYLFLL